MSNHPHIRLVAVIGIALWSAPVFAQQVHSQHPAGTKDSNIKTPASLAAEHLKLHAVLARAAKEGGEVGRAAEELEKSLAPHFKREEEIATPPLGLLPKLARSNATADMRSVLTLTQALERELPRMLREHDIIRTAAGKFRAAAAKAGRGEYVRFSDELAAHARQEEDILYPAAVLVGRYVARTAPEHRSGTQRR